MIDHPLEGAVLKLNRAEDHLQHIVHEVNTFRQGHLYDTVCERDYQGRLVVRAVNVQKPPALISVLIGEFIYNIRSALDHVAYQLAVLEHGSPLSGPIARASEFPLMNNGKRFRGTRTKKGWSHGSGRHKLQGVSRQAVRVIDSLQPYHYRTYPANIALLALEELSNIDKHRLLHLTAVAPMAMQLGLRGTTFFSLSGYKVFAGILRERSRLALVYGDFSLPGLEAGITMRADVVFDERGDAAVVRGESVIKTLVAIQDVVSFHAMPKLAALFPDTEYEAHLAEPREAEPLPLIDGRGSPLVADDTDQ